MTVFSFVLLATGGSAGYSSHLIRLKDHAPIKCTASIAFFNKEMSANFTLDFMHNQDKHTGIISVSGNVFQDNHPKGTIRRDVLYTWTEKHGTYKMVSTQINKLGNVDTLSDEYFAKIFPAFYVYPNSPLNYSFISQGKNGFMITIGKRPLYFCAR